MKFSVFALTVFFTCVAAAQDSGKTKPTEGPSTASAAEVKAKADNGATGLHDLPLVKEEVERERIATEKISATNKNVTKPPARSEQQPSVKPTDTQVEKANIRPADRKK